MMGAPAEARSYEAQLDDLRRRVTALETQLEAEPPQGQVPKPAPALHRGAP